VPEDCCTADFDKALVRFGSKAAEMIGAMQRPMSALPPKADKWQIVSVRPLCAISRQMAVQQLQPIQSPRRPPRPFVRYRAVFSSEAGKFVGSFRKSLVLLGHLQKKVLMRGVSLLPERAQLFGACAPMGSIQMGMISHSMQYQWTSSTIPFAKIRNGSGGKPERSKKASLFDHLVGEAHARQQDRSYQDFKRRENSSRR